jgi:hypothetical protein
MSKLKQLQLNIAHLIDNTTDQETLIKIFFEVKTGGASAMLRNKTAQTIIDLKSIYGKNLDEAVSILLNTEHSVNLTESGEDDGIQTKDRPDSGN